MATLNIAPKLVSDIAERTVLTYVEAFLGLLLASGTTNLIALSALESAAIAAIPMRPRRGQGSRRLPPRPRRNGLVAPRQNRPRLHHPQLTTGAVAMPDGEIALELAELRRALEVGLARIDGQLALLVQRSDQIDKAVEELDARVAALEKSRWPLPAISTLTGLAALGVAIWSATGR